MFKLSVGVNEFARVLAIAGKCVDAKPVIPIQGDVLVSSNESGFTITSSNSEMRIEIPIEMSIESGDFKPFCVDYAKMSSAVSTLAKGTDIVFDVEDKKVVVNHSTGKFSVPIQDGKDYPIQMPLDEKEGVYSFKCDGASFVKNVNLAKLCVSEDKLRPFICTICLDVIGSNMNIVSTNGFSFYLKKNEPIEVLSGEGAEYKLLIPSTALNAIAGVFASSETITISTDNRQIHLTDENNMVYSVRMVEGAYPNYLMLIPQVENNDVVVDRKMLETILKRASIFANNQSGMVVLTKEGSNLNVSGEDLFFHTSINDKLPIKNESSVEEGFKIGCNLVYLNNVLCATESEDVVFKFNDTPTKAFLLVEKDGNADKVLVLMPMKI